jgi:hypothetical protein
MEDLSSRIQLNWRIGGFGHVSLKRLVCPKSDGNFNGENNHIHVFFGSLCFTPKNTKTIVFLWELTRKKDISSRSSRTWDLNGSSYTVWKSSELANGTNSVGFDRQRLGDRLRFQIPAKILVARFRPVII